MGKGDKPFEKMSHMRQRSGTSTLGEIGRILGDGEFPTTRGEVARRAGHLMLQRDSGEEMSLRDVLARVEEERFNSLAELATAVEDVLGAEEEREVKDPSPESLHHPHA